MRDDYRRVYGDEVALTTTASAFGRSSVYNRLKYRNEPTFVRVGWTKGCGRFHFDSGDLLEEMCKFAERNHPNCPSHDRLFTISACLKLLGLPANWIVHGIKREMFVVPMAFNTRAWLNDRTDKPLDYVSRPMADIVDWWKERWLLKRVSWDKRWLDVDGKSIRLWPESDGGLRGTQLSLIPNLPTQTPTAAYTGHSRYVSKHLEKKEESPLLFPEIDDFSPPDFI